MVAREQGPSTGGSDGVPGIGSCGEAVTAAESCCGALTAAAGRCIGDEIGFVDLTGLDEADRLEALAALTARFSASYLRSVGGRGDFLSYPRVRVLEVLRRREPVIMRDLADALGMTARNITAIVDALEQAGLVVRRPHPTDRRATVVDLTSRGQETTTETRSPSLSKVATAFNTLPPDDQQRYADLISRLSAALSER
jgi:DNA-binding MarR family transcriptional regulator